MERKINRKIEESYASYKEEIKRGIVGAITSINCYVDSKEHNFNTVELKQHIQKELMDLLQELYDHPVLQLEKLDFQKRKRVKNIVPLHDRRTACRASGEQCTRRKKNGLQFCGTHSKGTPHGVISEEIANNDNKPTSKKIAVWAQDIKGIIYYIDDNSNVYDTAAVMMGTDNPKVIAKYTKQLDEDGNTKYEIPEYNI